MQSVSLLTRLILLAGLAAGIPAAAQAQSNPSTDDIIKSLRPGPSMGATTRGIRPSNAAPASAAPADTAAAPIQSAPPAVATPRVAPPPGRPNPGTTAARNPPPASPPVAPPVVATGAAPSVNLTIDFASNSTVLTPSAARSLGELGRALASPALASYRFRIEGHTDTVGSPEANKALSDRRAQAVADFLATHFRIDRARLDAVGVGEVGLLVQTPPQTAEARNRRVQIVNIGT